MHYYRQNLAAPRPDGNGLVPGPAGRQQLDGENARTSGQSKVAGRPPSLEAYDPADIHSFLSRNWMTGRHLLELMVRERQGERLILKIRFLMSACIAMTVAAACTPTTDSSRPQTAATVASAAPPSNVQESDWAVGEWSGFRLNSGDRASLRPVQGTLIVTRRSDGALSCTGRNNENGNTFPITTCVADANGLRLASASAGGFQANMTRTAPNQITGKVEIVGSSFRYDLTLTKA